MQFESTKSYLSTNEDSNEKMDNFIDAGGFFAFAVSTVIGFVIGHLIGSSKCKTSQLENYKEFPQVKELLNNGWTWGERPADANQ